MADASWHAYLDVVASEEETAAAAVRIIRWGPARVAAALPLADGGKLGAARPLRLRGTAPSSSLPSERLWTAPRRLWLPPQPVAPAFPPPLHVH